MSPAVLLASLVALLIGLAVGKAWERYKLQDGVWIDRRRARESPHYMLGLNFLVANQIDQAIDELSKAARGAGDALEIHLILGNLYREKGQVGRAIQEHQGLLQRPKLRKLEHANVLLCLGLDYRSGGFVDRAIAAFSEVLKLDPDNRYALSNLEKLHEDQHQWKEAYAMRQRLAALSANAGGGVDSPRHDEVLAFLENEFGQAALKSGDMKEASRRFQAAIERDPRNTPAHLSLGDLRPCPRRGRPAGRAARSAARSTSPSAVEEAGDRRLPVPLRPEHVLDALARGAAAAAARADELH